jgi:hypothetical protein
MATEEPLAIKTASGFVLFKMENDLPYMASKSQLIL